jgi:DNA polymerase III epsilon subunit-like protein
MAKSAKYIVLDLETAGLCSVTDRILEVAALRTLPSSASSSLLSGTLPPSLSARRPMCRTCTRATGFSRTAKPRDEDYTWSTVSARLYGCVHLHHQHIDVSCLINTMNLVEIPFTRVAASTHRAMADAQASYDTWVEILSVEVALGSPDEP